MLAASWSTLNPTLHWDLSQSGRNFNLCNWTSGIQQKYKASINSIISSIHRFELHIYENSHWECWFLLLFLDLILSLLNELYFWDLSCQTQAGRLPWSTCIYCKCCWWHCSLLSAPASWASKGSKEALLELALLLPSLTVKATKVFWAKRRCHPRCPVRSLL